MFWVIVLIIVLVYLFVKSYNGLQRSAQHVHEMYSNIRVYLQKYVETINKLQEVVKDYAGYEKLITLKVSDNIQELSMQTKQAMTNVLALAQNYPELKANISYQQLMGEISRIQTELANVRATYNDAVRNYNSQLATIPQVLYAKSCHFEPASYYDPDNLAAMKDFSTDDGQALQELIKKGSDKTIGMARQAKDMAYQAKDQISQTVKDKKIFKDDAKEETAAVKSEVKENVETKVAAAETEAKAAAAETESAVKDAAAEVKTTVDTPTVKK